MSDERRFIISIDHLSDMQFKVGFDWDGVPELMMDEPTPLGDQAGPNASRLVAAAAGNCLSASLLFCLQKAKIEPAAVHTQVIGTVGRNDKGRLRLRRLEVKIELDGVEGDPSRLRRCLTLFEDFCVVTEALRTGFPVEVAVVDPEGNPFIAPSPPT
jgi:organic hydroperoxide reductase OsmC/OhrA